MTALERYCCICGKSVVNNRTGIQCDKCKAWTCLSCRHRCGPPALKSIGIATEVT